MRFVFIIPNRLFIFGFVLTLVGVLTFGQRVRAEPVQAIEVDKNNIVATYTPSKYQGPPIYFDGGRGIDTLVIRMTDEEYNTESVLTDVIRFNYFLLQHINPQRQQGRGEIFTFESFPIKVRNFEILEIKRLSNTQYVSQN